MTLSSSTTDVFDCSTPTARAEAHGVSAPAERDETCQRGQMLGRILAVPVRPRRAYVLRAPSVNRTSTSASSSSSSAWTMPRQACALPDRDRRPQTSVSRAGGRAARPSRGARAGSSAGPVASSRDPLPVHPRRSPGSCPDDDHVGAAGREPDVVPPGAPAVRAVGEQVDGRECLRQPELGRHDAQPFLRPSRDRG